MKTIIKIFAAVLAVTPVLVSCYSEPLPEVIPEVIPEDGDETEQDTTARVITLSFDTKATRTVLSDETDYFSVPVFRPNDEIVVAQADGQAEPQTIKLTEDSFVGEVATIKTNLSGSLVAVYPASCALYDSGNTKKITGVKVPSKQNGTFANANICMATQTDDDIAQNRLRFKNKTAVFVVDLPYPEETIELVVESLYKISSSTGQRDEKVHSDIAFDETGGHYQIIVQDDVNGLTSPCFVSVYVGDGTLLRDLNFDAIFTYDATGEIPATGSSGGFSPRFLEGYNLSLDTRVQAGLIYSGVGSCLHRYFTTPHDATKNLPTLRWAIDDLKVNGGTFFMWGELNGHSYVPAEGDNPAYWTGFANEGGFASTNKNTLSKAYKKNEILILEDDSVYQNWGGAWRMPTMNEFLVLDDYGGEDSFAEYMSCWNYVSGISAPSHSSNHFYWTSQMAGNNMNIQVFRYTISVDNIIDGGSISVGNSYYYGICIKPVAPID